MAAGACLDEILAELDFMLCKSGKVLILNKEALLKSCEILKKNSNLWHSKVTKVIDAIESVCATSY